MDSPNDSKPLREIKQMLNLEKESSKVNSENNSSHTFTPTSNVRNGFRRKKGDSPLTYNLNLKVKKEKQSNCTQHFLASLGGPAEIPQVLDLW